MPLFKRPGPTPVDPAATPPAKETRRARRARIGIEEGKARAERLNALRGTGKSTRTKTGRKTGEPKYGRPIGPDEITPCEKGVKGKPGCGRAQGRPHVTSVCGKRGKVGHGGK